MITPGSCDWLSGLLLRVYGRLLDQYGPQGWWPAESRFEVIVGAILTQSTAWVNVEKALASMRTARCWSFEAIAAIPEADLAAVIRSSGYYNAKARKLRAFAWHVLENHGADLDGMFNKDVAELRSELLSIHGIGEETADDIIVYAADKPSFVIDSYTRRIIDRMEPERLRGKTRATAPTRPCFRTTCRPTLRCSTSTTPCWTITPKLPASNALRAATAAAWLPSALRVTGLCILRKIDAAWTAAYHSGVRVSGVRVGSHINSCRKENQNAGSQDIHR